MPQYRNKQFSSNWLKPERDEWQNAPFQYPRRVVRHSTFDQNGERVTTSKILERGFMRNLMTETVSTTGAVDKQVRQRFNFQFNPAAIEQAVQMRQDIYLPILQQPEQFAQPMSAIASFNFEILLDRTMEVGSSTVNNLERTNANTINVDLYGKPNPSLDVYQIGVLSDLQVLYSIIGQGFSNQFILSQLENIRTQARLSAAFDENSTVTESDIDSLTSDKFEANFGNNAFLIPMPVRAVFSELFMIDGFVTSTTVRFTKFNTNMVPIQASIFIGMNALYIGFAKEKTFLTVQLENAKNVQIERAQETIDAQNEILQALRDSAKEFVFATDSSRDWLNGVSGSVGTQIWQYAVQQYETDYPDVEFKFGFIDAKRKGDADKVLQLFKTGKTFSVSTSWNMSVYGPYSSQSAAEADVRNKRISTGIKRRGYYVGDHTASDAASWEEGRSKSIRSDNPITNNLATDKLAYSEEDTSKYFVVVFNAIITAGNSSQEVVGWRSLSGLSKYSIKGNIQWPAPSSVGGTSNPSGVSGTGYVNDIDQYSQFLSF